MKKFNVSFLFVVLISGAISNTHAQNNFSLNPTFTFGPHTDGSIRPGDSIGNNPFTGFNILISAPTVTNAWMPGEIVQDQRPTGSTNGFNMRGLTYDPVSGNLVFVDTHLGSAGSVGGNGTNSPYCGIYILDSTTGQIIGALSTNGIFGGQWTHVVACVADDGVVFVCNQSTASQTTGFKIYRWPTADTNNPAFTNAPIVAFTNTIGPSMGTSGERLGETMDVRGAGTNTQIIVASSSLNGTGTNIFLFTTADGTNFTPHRISFPGVITTPVFNDGLAFGPTNTFWCKQVGKPFLYLSYDAVGIAGGASQVKGTVISSFTASSPNDPLLNISAITVDITNHLLAGLEEIGGTATGGRGKVWLFDLFDPTNHAPAVLTSQTYVPNFQKTVAPMGYLKFGNGRLYAHASNNGFLVNTVTTVSLGAPSFTQDLPSTTRALTNTTAHFEVFAVVDVTNYQWFTNSIPVPGATTYSLDVPNVTTNMSGIVFSCVASNAAGATASANSTLAVFDTSSYFHLQLLWSMVADATNYITGGGGAGTPRERTIAYNALSNQLLVVKGVVSTVPTIFVVDPDTGTFLYTLNTTNLDVNQTLNLCDIGVADDGAVYAANTASDNSFRIYRWADSGSNTLPVVIWGTNSVNTSANYYNPVFDWTGAQMFRFGDNLAVHGSGLNTEIVLDAATSAKYAGILRPTDATMTNWSSAAYLLANAQGSYGSEAYGLVIGRSLQFGNGSTFWQKRYNGTAGAPLAEMSYPPTTFSLASLVVANSSLPLFTNGPVGINFPLNVAAAVNFFGSVSALSSTPDSLAYYDLSDPSQAVLLSTTPLPGAGTAGGHKQNNNAIAQVIFGVNPVSNTNYIFTINGNNGISTHVLAGGTIPPPKFITQPKNLRVLVGSSGAMSAAADQIATLSWFKGTNSPVDTGIRGSIYNIANADTNSAGDYFVVATNLNGSVTSRVAHVSVSLTNDNYSLSQVWTAPAGNPSYPYSTANGGANTPNERSFAYNALSNQLVVVRCPPASTVYTNFVVDATSGALLYTLNTAGLIHMGNSEVSGANPIDEVGAAAADDGAIYIASESPNASGGASTDPTKMMHVFRWADTGPTTVPVLIFEGDPSGPQAGNNLRWGDVMAARGSGTNTELLLNSFEGTWAATLRPTSSSMNGFTNYPIVDVASGGSIGRSIQFGPTNSIYEKRRGGALFFSSFTNQSETLLNTVDSSSTLGGVAVDLKHGLAAGVDFVGGANKPDAVALYDIADPTAPLLLGQYSFPSNQVANANSICQTIIYGNKVYALDGNNGFMSFTINGPRLSITQSGANVVVTWGLFNGYTLQATPSLTPPITWTNVAPPAPINIVNGKNTVTNAVSATQLFYRLAN